MVDVGDDAEVPDEVGLGHGCSRLVPSSYGPGVPTREGGAGRLPRRMANIKSQIKRNRQNERARARNKSVRTALKTAQKKVREAVGAGDQEQATALNLDAARALDKAVSGGAIHKRTAARRKSRL